MKGLFSSCCNVRRKKNREISLESPRLSCRINVVWRRWKIPASDLKILFCSAGFKYLKTHYQTRRTCSAFCYSACGVTNNTKVWSQRDSLLLNLHSHCFDSLVWWFNMASHIFPGPLCLLRFSQNKVFFPPLNLSTCTRCLGSAHQTAMCSSWVGEVPH